MTTNIKKKINIGRIIACSLVLVLLMALMLYFYSTYFQDILEKLQEKGKLENVEWVLDHLAYAVPGIVIAAVMATFYSNKDKYVLSVSQKEMGIISIIVALFTYLVILPYVISKKPVATEELSEVKSLIDITAKWFFAQMIPFVLLPLYHFVRSESEEKEQTETEKIEQEDTDNSGHV